MAGDAALRRLLSRLRFDQAANGATTAALVVELGKLYLTGQMTREEFGLGLVAAEKLGFESAGRIAASHLRSVRALSRADGVIEHARFEPGPAAVRAQATLEALDRLDDPGARSRAVETHAVWADRAAKGGGRRTVERSAAASGRRWRRVPDADPCTFCAMLATRGYLDGGYVSEETALTAGNGKAYHDACGCVATEIVDGWVPNEQEQRWIDLYEDAAAAADAAGLPRTQDVILPWMKAHGDFNDSPSRNVWAQIRTASDLETHLVGIMTGRGAVVGFADDSLNLDRLRSIGRTVERLIAQYPEVRFNLVVTTERQEDGVAAFARYHRDTGEMSLNIPRDEVLHPVVAHRLERAREHQWWMLRDGALPDYDAYVVAHEFGHLVDYTTGNRWAKKGKVSAAQEARSVSEADRFQISEYGKSKPAEGVAEAFADVFINGKRASETSKRVHRKLVDKLRREGG